MAKATGIVRRIDDLGRIVIPKEIRKNLGITEGMSLEIFTDKICGQPAVCFVNYEPDVQSTADQLFNELESISLTGCIPAEIIKAQNTINQYIKNCKKDY